MSALVLFYSKSGNTRKVAKALADRLNAGLAEVACPAYQAWYGPLAMMWDIFTRHLPPVRLELPPDAGYDLVIVGGPVWAAHAAPPVLSALGHMPRSKATALFVTCRGASQQSPPEPAIEEMKEATSAANPASHIFREDDIRGVNLAREVSAFAARLGAQALA